MRKLGVLGSGPVAKVLAKGLKPVVARIIDQFGWEGADMGRATAARAIEPLCQLWCIPGLRANSWTHAFRLLRA